MDTGLLPIHTAVESQNYNSSLSATLNCLKIMLDAGVKVNSKTLVGGNTILHIIALKGVDYNEILEFICIKADVHIN